MEIYSLALQDLSGGMVDTLYAIDRWRRGKSMDPIAAADAAMAVTHGKDSAEAATLCRFRSQLQRADDQLAVEPPPAA